MTTEQKTADAAVNPLMLSEYIQMLQELQQQIVKDVPVLTRPVHWRVSVPSPPEIAYLLNSKKAKRPSFWVPELHKEEEKGEVVVEV